MNIVNVDISNGQTDFIIGSGCYVALVSAPSLANVTVKPNDQFSRPIPLKPSHSVKAERDFDRWIVNCNAVPGGMLQFLISDKQDPFILDMPLSNTTASIDSFGASAVAQMNDVITPYIVANSIPINTNSTVDVAYVNLVLDCDFIDIYLSNSIVYTNNSRCWNVAFLDNVPFLNIQGINYSGSSQNESQTCRVYGVRGKTLRIQGFSANGEITCGLLTKYSYKV